MKTLFLLITLINSLLITACTSSVNHEDFTEQALQKDRRTRDIIIKDREIENEAYSELNGDPDLRNQSHFTINTYNGATLVTGEASSEALKAKIIAKIQVIDHVKVVHDNLAIATPSDFEGRANDQAITENVTMALKQIRSLPDFDPAMIKVVTENGVVYLMGLVHREEGTVVINVTKLQPGIQEIITVFEYLD